MCNCTLVVSEMARIGFACGIHERIALKVVAMQNSYSIVLTHRTCMYPNIELTCATLATASTGVPCGEQKGRMHTTGHGGLYSPHILHMQ